MASGTGTHSMRGRVAASLCVGLLAGCTRSPEPIAATLPTPAVQLTRALGGEPATLDPRLAADNPSLALMLDLYEGLATEAADGTIVPGAAKSWSVSDDGRTWTFRLRPGLEWSDGAPLRAVDFAQGIADGKATDTQAPNAALLDAIQAVAAPTDESLVVTLWRPVPYLPALLALPVAAPKRDASPSASTVYVSNGPYRLASRRIGERIELERNPHYHAAAEVAIARVAFVTTDDLNTELNLYRTGELDVTSEVPNARIEWIRATLPGELQVSPYLSTYAYAVNLARVPSREAREALAMSIDRGALVEKVTGAGETAAVGWVPPGLADYENASFDWISLPSGSRLARARQLWQQVAPTRARLTLCTDASANHHRTAVALADQWKRALGVDIEIVEREWKAFLATREHPTECDLVRFGWSADFADPEAFLTLFESRHPQNSVGYSSREYDQLLYDSRRASDPAQRARLLARAESVLLRDAPIIPVFHRVSKRLIKPYVTGATDNALGQLPTRYLAVRK